MAGQKDWLQHKKLQRLKTKTPHIYGLVATATLNTKATEIENKIPDVPDPATKNAFDTKAKEIEKKNLNLSHYDTK